LPLCVKPPRMQMSERFINVHRTFVHEMIWEKLPFPQMNNYLCNKIQNSPRLQFFRNRLHVAKALDDTTIFVSYIFEGIKVSFTNG